ncbi:hypothetical protein K502DRAFT_368545 [Neoconidiobolus thromboides FSU 785]|nr:hypothetical protein K502DRAFT_368545 [Neoconidiobolus thromboides FSU 785]
MQLQNLAKSPTAGLQAHLITVGNYRILLDCGLSQRNSSYITTPSLPIPTLGLSDLLSFLNEKVEIESIDLILISNYQFCLALPFITEYTKFKGKILATEPTRYFCGKLLEEVALLFQNKNEMNENGNEGSYYTWDKNDMNRKKEEGLFYYNCMYTFEEAKLSHKKIQTLSYRQKMNYYQELYITPFCSGYSLGACNWLIEYQEIAFGYISSSSLINNNPNNRLKFHNAKMDFNIFNLANQILFKDNLSNLNLENCHPIVNLDKLVNEIRIDLENNKMVIIPSLIMGITFDILEAIAFKLINTNWGSKLEKTPILVISPSAEYNLRYANICAEWMNSDYQDNLRRGESAFLFSRLIEREDIKIVKDHQESSVASSIETGEGIIILCSYPNLNNNIINDLINLKYKRNICIKYWDGMFLPKKELSKDINFFESEIKVDIKLTIYQIVQLIINHSNTLNKVILPKIMKNEIQNSILNESEIQILFEDYESDYLLTENNNLNNQLRCSYFKFGLMNLKYAQTLKLIKNQKNQTATYLKGNLNCKDNLFLLGEKNQLNKEYKKILNNNNNINEMENQIIIKQDYLPFMGFNKIHLNELCTHLNSCGIKTEVLELNEENIDNKEKPIVNNAITIDCLMLNCQLEFTLESIIIYSEDIIISNKLSHMIYTYLNQKFIQPIKLQYQLGKADNNNNNINDNNNHNNNKGLNNIHKLRSPNTNINGNGIGNNKNRFRNRNRGGNSNGYRGRRQQREE